MTELPSTATPGYRGSEPAEPRTIVIFERRPRWGPELQRQLAGEEIRVRWCTELSEVERRTADTGTNVVVLHFDETPGECLQWIEHAGRSPRPVPVICIGSEQTSDLEWIARELGGLQFYPEFVSGREIAALCRRQFRQSPDN